MIECLFKHAPGNYSEIFRNGGICGKKKINQRTSVPSVRLKGKAREKARESISAVIPIVLIVFILGFTVAALSPGILVEFLVGSVLVILGMIFFPWEQNYP